MIPDSESKGYAKTSLMMTRSMAQDIGLKIRAVLEKADVDKLIFTYTQWQEYVSGCWNDTIWIEALNIAITRAMVHKINLNKNFPFIILVKQKSFPQLKLEMEKAHLIAKLALKDNIMKDTPKPEKKHMYEDIWLTPEERQKLYMKQKEEE